MESRLSGEDSDEDKLCEQYWGNRSEKLSPLQTKGMTCTVMALKNANSMIQVGLNLYFAIEFLFHRT